MREPEFLIGYEYNGDSHDADDPESLEPLNRVRSVRASWLGSIAPPSTFDADDRAYALLDRTFGGVDMASMPRIPPSAPCLLPDANPNDWHPPYGKHASADLIGLDQSGVIDEVAAWLCEGCPVLEACGDWALANLKQEGIMGGMTHDTRKRVRVKESK